MREGIRHNDFHESVEVGVRSGAQHCCHPINDVGERLFLYVTTGSSEALAMLRREIDGQPQRVLNGDFPVAEGLVGEDLRLLCFLEVHEGN